MEIDKHEVEEALAYAWVLGWYAGCAGVTNDSGKIEAAKELLRRLIEED